MKLHKLHVVPVHRVRESGGMGDITKNFDRREFVCGHCGRLDALEKNFVRKLQRLRDIVGRPLVIVSGYRCPEGNASVGGSKYSQHIWGRAADIPRGYATVAQCKAAGFSGIGVRGGQVVHVDTTPARVLPRTYLKPFVFDD